MHERFSDRARHAMALANLEASNLNHRSLRPAHLLLGLIAEGVCVATEALRVLDVDLDAVRDDVRAQLCEEDKPGSVGARAQTKELKEVTNLAIQEARRFGHRYVGTEHMVLALLAQEDSLPSRTLRKLGLDVATLREKALSLLRSAGDPGHDVQHSRHGNYEWIHQQELSKAFRSPKFWHTMIMAVDSADRLGASEILPHHLLLALLRDQSNGIARILAEKGVTVDWLQERVTDDADSRMA